MSILLDAVTRNKQQQLSPLPDAVLTPRSPNASPVRPALPLGKLSLVGLAIAVGIGLAWGLTLLRQANDVSAPGVVQHPGSTMPSRANAAQNATAPSMVNATANVDASQKLSPAGQEPPEVDALTAQGSDALVVTSSVSSNGSGIRLAGKVALPRAQELPSAATMVMQQTATMPLTGSIPQPTAVRPSGNQDPSYVDYLTTSAAVDAISYEQQPSAAATDTQVTPAVYGDIAQAAVTQDPINQDRINQDMSYQEPHDLALRAGDNGAERQGVDPLALLRQQVSAAAADVGLETHQSREEDRLVATFQSALKGVEYGNAANTAVTAAHLDPTPKPAADDIPKYGQLPAGLQLQVPEFNIVAHVYSTNASQRWLNVDGAELQEGDMIAGKLKIIAIRPRDVVLAIQDTQFKVPAI